MKVLFVLVFLASAGVSVFMKEKLDSGPEVVTGHYVEARSAAVFAGPCHYNGEVQMQGRSALMAWQLDQGEWQGVDLGGAQIAVATTSEENLADGDARQSVVYVHDAMSGEARDAAVAWLRSRHGEALGEVLQVRVLPFDFELQGEGYSLKIDGVLELSGETMPDRACCSMPENVWYEPLTESIEPMVGHSSICRFEGDEGLDPWAYQGQNNAFVGTICEGFQSCCATATRQCLQTEETVSE